eukprot:450800-Hanusia_phi.AAC.1
MVGEEGEEGEEGAGAGAGGSVSCFVRLLSLFPSAAAGHELRCAKALEGEEGDLAGAVPLRRDSEGEDEEEA